MTNSESERGFFSLTTNNENDTIQIINIRYRKLTVKNKKKSQLSNTLTPSTFKSYTAFVHF